MMIKLYKSLVVVQLASVTIDGRLFAVPKYDDGSWYVSISQFTMRFTSLSSAVDAIIRLAIGKASVYDINELRAIAYDREFTELDDLYEFEMQEFAMDEDYENREAM